MVHVIPIGVPKGFSGHALRGEKIVRLLYLVFRLNAWSL
jgi:hypothetical protein